MKRILTLFAALACAAALPAQAQTDNALAVSCENNELEVYAHSPNVRLRCEASGLPEGEKYVYEWFEQVNGEWNHAVNLTNKHSARPKFIVPESAEIGTKYEFMFTARSEDRLQYAAINLSIEIIDGNLDPTKHFDCTDLITYEGKLITYEGKPVWFTYLGCTITWPHDAQAGWDSEKGRFFTTDNGEKVYNDIPYSFRWEVRGDTPPEAINLLNSTDDPYQYFHNPENIGSKKYIRYKYQLLIYIKEKLVSKRNLTVTVRNIDQLVSCPKIISVNEGDSDIQFGCVRNISRKAFRNMGGDVVFTWEVRGDTPPEAINLLSSTNDQKPIEPGVAHWNLNPTFTIPEVDKKTTYKYRLNLDWIVAGSTPMMQWEGVMMGTATRNIAITVLDRPSTNNKASDPEGPSVEMLTQLAEGSATQAAEELPGAVALEQNYPNPFNPSTAIRYELPAAEHVRLDVFDVSGRNVKVLVDGTRPAGTHTARFDAGGLPSGLYVYRLQAGGNTIVKTMHLIR